MFHGLVYDAKYNTHSSRVRTRRRFQGESAKFRCWTDTTTASTSAGVHVRQQHVRLQSFTHTCHETLEARVVKPQYQCKKQGHRRGKTWKKSQPKSRPIAIRRKSVRHNLGRKLVQEKLNWTIQDPTHLATARSKQDAESHCPLHRVVCRKLGSNYHGHWFTQNGRSCAETVEK